MSFPHLQTFQRFAPATFAERGVLVPFTSPALMGTRTRLNDRDRLELLLPGFSGGHTHYVVPWPAVPEVARMTVHDRALHEEIETNEICVPHDMRLAALKVATSGLAGPEVAETARKTLEDDKSYRTSAHFLLVIQILQGLGLDIRKLLEMGLESEEGQREARRSMGQAAARFGLRAEELYGRVSELSSLASPVGIESAKTFGRLRTLLDRLSGFRDSVAKWSDEAMADKLDGAPVAAFCADVADRTLRLGQQDLARFDGMLRDLETVICGWPQAPVELRDLATHLSWLLDGWEWLIQRWDETIELSRHEQMQALAEILTFLPVLPKDQDRRLVGETPQPLGGLVHQRWVKAFEDWRTGQLDLDLIERIEARKAAMA